jgi:hypothetical protein
VDRLNVQGYVEWMENRRFCGDAPEDLDSEEFFDDLRTAVDEMRQQRKDSLDRLEHSDAQ